VSTANGKIVLRGTLEQHEAMASGVIKTPKADVNSEDLLERKTFTLSATNQPVKAILESLKRQLNLELVIDTVKIRQAGRSLDKLVSVKVKDAPLDETLTAVLTPADLKFTRRGKTVEITAAAP
jgi:hypothetical protein